MAFSTSRHAPTPEALDEALQEAREALERLRATLATWPLSDVDPSRQVPGPGPSRGHRDGVCR